MFCKTFEIEVQKVLDMSSKHGHNYEIYPH